MSEINLVFVEAEEDFGFLGVLKLGHLGTFSLMTEAEGGSSKTSDLQIMTPYLRIKLIKNSETENAK